MLWLLALVVNGRHRENTEAEDGEKEDDEGGGGDKDALFPAAGLVLAAWGRFRVACGLLRVRVRKGKGWE